jgi:hypothetical protein
MRAQTIPQSISRAETELAALYPRPRGWKIIRNDIGS